MTSEVPLKIGALIYDGIDQIDLTGPFEVLSRIPKSKYQLYAKSTKAVKDVGGLRLIPDAELHHAPLLDILHIPGGHGQEALMEDEEVLAWIRKQAKSAKLILSVCTGALLCGAAGLLKGRRATTHWSALHLLKYFGATASSERVLIDDKMIFAAGVTAGIDGALTLVSELCGKETAELIQLNIAYAPAPPFNAGTPESAPPTVLREALAMTRELTLKREITAKRVGLKLT